MKGSSISSVVLTALIVITSLFQPHQHNKLAEASQNNTDEGANGCIGLHCLIAVDDEADLFMNQLRNSKVLNIANALAADKLPFNCGINKHYTGSSCVDKVSPQYMDMKFTGRCSKLNRDPAYHPAGC